jgi:UDP-3-O-[3-hydroxymyristoyl] glucosamine N-acyltransferase
VFDDIRAYVGDACILGNHVMLKPQAVVGSEGFGWAFLDGALQRIPQIGIVELGDDVQIGANSCVDRAQTGVTAIGEGTKIDNLVQIGHNCSIGKHCAIAAQTGLAGSTIVGDYVQIGGQVGIAGHLHIGTRARIAARSAVWGNIADDTIVSGSPARPHRDVLKIGPTCSGCRNSTIASKRSNGGSTPIIPTAWARAPERGRRRPGAA